MFQVALLTASPPFIESAAILALTPGVECLFNRSHISYSDTKYRNAGTQPNLSCENIPVFSLCLLEGFTECSFSRYRFGDFYFFENADV